MKFCVSTLVIYSDYVNFADENVIYLKYDQPQDHIYTAIYEYTKQLSNMKTFNHNGRDS